MKKHLQYQRILMEGALRLQKEMEETKRIWSAIDQKYMADKLQELQEQYAEIMANLARHLCAITGYMMVAHPEPGNVVEIAEQKFKEVI